MTKHTVRNKDSFLAQVIEATPGGERLLHCLQCGSCGGSCPSGADMEHTPRTIFALINAGERERVLSANTMWVCVSCYFCTTRCPQEVPITDVMYTLKRMSIAQRLYHDTDAPALAKAFTDFVDKYGRSFEMGLATSYHLLNRPLQAMKMGPMGFAMFKRGRMALTPSRIKNIGQLQAIIRKAKDINAEEKS
jgi:heterodisulfide reductase subunit C